MIAPELLLDAVTRAVDGLPAVEGVTLAPEGLGVEVKICDFLGGGELAGEKADPWIMQIRQIDDYTHPLLGDTYPVVELYLVLLNISTVLPGHREMLAAHAAQCLDQQRFCPGVSATMDPGRGNIGVYAQFRVVDEDPASLAVPLRDRIRNAVALVYLFSFRIWQLRLTRRVPDEAAVEQITEEAHTRMLQLLGARPPGA